MSLKPALPVYIFVDRLEVQISGKNEPSELDSKFYTYVFEISKGLTELSQTVCRIKQVTYKLNLYFEKCLPE